MIQGFSTIVQNDIACLCKDLPGLSKMNDQQKEKVHRAAIRTLAVLGMILSAAVVIGAFSATTTIAAFFKLSLAIGLYVCSHDVFTMSWNMDKQIQDQIKDIGKNILDVVADQLKGKIDGQKKDLKSAHFYTQGTFLRPIWDSVL